MITTDTKIHLIGVGGSGMSAIARVLAERGYIVSGSDIKESRNTESLRSFGVEVLIGQKPENLERKDVVVTSTAIGERNPELAEARRRGLPIMHRAEMLAELMNSGRGVAIAGTHGKTTTTSMTAFALVRAGMDPTFIVGGELNDVGTNAASGGEIVVAEADESDGSLVHLRPHIGVITNIEADHLDHYASIDEIIEVFRTFATSLPEDGLLILCGDDPRAAALASEAPCRAVTYGFSGEPDFLIEEDGAAWSVSRAGEKLVSLRPGVPGRHNVLNATAAYIAARELGAGSEAVAEALAGFGGVKRRFQLKGEAHGRTVIDDYAHHPTEVAATLRAAAGLGKWQRIVAAFQPHRYSRTAKLADDFGAAFSDADVVVVADVYPAGEEPIPGVSGRSIVEALLSSEPGKEVIYLPHIGDIIQYMPERLRAGDLFVTLGAGDIWMAGEGVLQRLAGPAERE